MSSEERIEDLKEGFEAPEPSESESEDKVNWDDPEEFPEESEDAMGGVSVGLGPMGITVQVTPPGGGETASKVIDPQEAHIMAGQLIALATFVMNMSFAAQMAEAQKLQQLIQQGEEKTPGGVYVKRR